MSFFDDEPPAVEEQPEPEPPERSPSDGPSDDELPTVLPAAAVLTAGDRAALLLAGVRVFSDGLALDLQIRVRRHGLDDDDWDDLMSRAGGPGRLSRGRQHGGEPRFGVELSDGTRVRTGDEPEPGSDVPRLVQRGGSGSGADRFWTSEWTYWLWPLPPDGPLTVVADWPRLDLPQGSTVVDGGDLAATAAAVARVWPDADVGGPSRAAQTTWSTSFAPMSPSARTRSGR